MYAFMQDIHIGAKFSTQSLFDSLDTFLDIIKKHKEPCECIFVCGDLFEHKLTIEESKIAALFLAKLVCNNCSRIKGFDHVPVHFIHGTYSHDREQYEMFLPILREIPGVEIEYISEHKVLTLNDGTKVLYLPQEYGKDKLMEYDELFSHEYDIIVGHGPISSDTNSPCPATDYDILHSAEQLGKISKICIFGHYHGFTDFGNNVYYGGPWLRWKYGEDEPRQFVFCRNDFTIEKYPNPHALEYKTVDIGSPEELREYISKNIETPHRFCITIAEEDLPEYHAIMNLNKNNSNISYKISSIKKQEINDEKIANEYTRTSVVEPIPALIEYIKDKYGIDTTEELKDYESKINKDLEK